MAKIAVDCDGVLANFIKSFTEEANYIWPGRFKPDYHLHHAQWDFTPGVLSKPETNQVWRRINATPNWWLRLDAFSENVGALMTFLQGHHSHDVYIVTSRAETVGMTVAKQTATWLAACGVQEHQNYLAIVPIDNSNNKADFYRIGCFDMSVDDKTETVEQCDQLPDHHAYLLDQPWNQDANVKRRIKSLDKFFDDVR